jgi:hypothetical protein
VRAANAIASSGQRWAAVLAQHNSGTYNNQVGLWILTLTLTLTLTLAAPTTTRLDSGFWSLLLQYLILLFDCAFDISSFSYDFSSKFFTLEYVHAFLRKVFPVISLAFLHPTSTFLAIT